MDIVLDFTMSSRVEIGDKCVVTGSGEYVAEDVGAVDVFFAYSHIIPWVITAIDEEQRGVGGAEERIYLLVH